MFIGNVLHAQERVPADTLRLSLDSCIRYAFGHNVSVRTAQLRRELAVRSLEAAKLRFLPSLSLQAGEDITLFGGLSSVNASYGMGGSWTLYEGWNTVNSFRKMKAEQRQSVYAEEKSRNEVEVQLLQAYLDILAEQDHIGCLEELLRSSLRQAEDAAEKAKLGSIVESDRLLLEASFCKLQRELENARTGIEGSLAELRLLLGLPERVALIVMPVDTALALQMTIPPMEETVRQALENLPDTKIAGLEREKAAYDLRCARGMYAPALTLGAYASYFGGEHTRTDASGMLVTSGGLNTTLSIGLNIPVFSRGANRMQVVQGRIALQQAELQEWQIRREVVQRTEACYRGLLQACNTMQASAAMQKAAAASLQAYQAKFLAGSVSATDWIQQRERYLSATNDYVRSKYAYILSQMILQIYLGRGL